MRKIIMSIVFLILSSSLIYSKVPQTISYQGILKNSEGTFVKDGEYKITFNLYNTSTGGSSLWTEEQSVLINQGLFNVILGSVNPINLTFNEQYWLGIKIENTAELSSRIQLTSSAYSLNSQSVEDSSVTSSKILSGNVVKSLNGMTDNITLEGVGSVSVSEEGSILKITGSTAVNNYPSISAGNGLVGGGSSENITIDVGQGNGISVSENNVSLDLNVTDNLYVNEGDVNSISSGMIQNLAVGTSKIADTSITTSKIADRSITTSKISVSGASTGNALMYDGANILWQTLPPAELSLPYSGGINSNTSAFEIINSGTGIAGDFLSSGDLSIGGYNNGLGQVALFSIDNALNDNAALMSSTNGTGPAAFFLGEGASSKGVYISVPAGNAGLVVASGTKNAVVATSQGARKLYTEESSEVWFSDYGFGKMINSSSVITIDPLFAETVNLSEPYHIFLEEYGDADLYVSDRTPTSFEVKLRDGDQNVDFSFRIVAKRKGYENARLEHEASADNDTNLYPAKRSEFNAKKILLNQKELNSKKLDK